MKITVQHVPNCENEIILRCESIDEEMLHLLSILKSQSQKLCVYKEKNEMILLSPKEVLYCEAVDEKVFIYCLEEVYQTALSLLELEMQYTPLGFFRISKSMIINLNSISKLSSCNSGKIKGLLVNGEVVMVSRHYAPLLREKLIASTKL